MGSSPHTITDALFTPQSSSPNDAQKLVGNLTFGNTVHLKRAEDSLLSSNKDDLSIRQENVHGDKDFSPSKEAYADDDDEHDELDLDPRNVIRGSTGGGLQTEPTLDIPQTANLKTQMQYGSIYGTDDLLSSARGQLEVPIKLQKTSEKGRYILKADDPELRDVLRKGLQRAAEAKGVKKRTRFSDLVFTRQFTAFDRQNSESSPFHGFYTLFWLGTFLMLVKIAARNWQVYGSVFGRNEIMSMMFHRDVLVLGLTDGFMCASTVFCFLLQKTIAAGYLSWSKQGWIIQHVGINLSQTRIWLNSYNWKVLLSACFLTLGFFPFVFRVLSSGVRISRKLGRAINCGLCQLICFLDLADIILGCNDQLDHSSRMAVESYLVSRPSLPDHAHEAA